MLGALEHLWSHVAESRLRLVEPEGLGVRDLVRV